MTERRFTPRTNATSSNAPTEQESAPYVCQVCRLPISISQGAFDDQRLGALSAALDASFVVVGDADKTQPTEPNASEKLELAEAVYAAVADRTGVDMPVCNECADLVVARLRRERAEAERELQVYGAAISVLRFRVSDPYVLCVLFYYAAPPIRDQYRVRTAARRLVALSTVYRMCCY